MKTVLRNTLFVLLGCFGIMKSYGYRIYIKDSLEREYTDAELYVDGHLVPYTDKGYLYDPDKELSDVLIKHPNFKDSIHYQYKWSSCVLADTSLVLYLMHSPQKYFVSNGVRVPIRRLDGFWVLITNPSDTSLYSHISRRTGKHTDLIAPHVQKRVREKVKNLATQYGLVLVKDYIKEDSSFWDTYYPEEDFLVSRSEAIARYHYRDRRIRTTKKVNGRRKVIREGLVKVPDSVWIDPYHYKRKRLGFEYLPETKASYGEYLFVLERKSDQAFNNELSMIESIRKKSFVQYFGEPVLKNTDSSYLDGKFDKQPTQRQSFDLFLCMNMDTSRLLKICKEENLKIDRSSNTNRICLRGDACYVPIGDIKDSFKKKGYICRVTYPMNYNLDQVNHLMEKLVSYHEVHSVLRPIDYYQLNHGYIRSYDPILYSHLVEYEAMPDFLKK